MSNHPAALVTGGSRGIGRGICIEIAKLGWRVGVNFASNADAAAETVDLIKKSGGHAEAVQGDVANASQRKYIIEFVRQRFGRFDALINNAGIGPTAREDILDASETSFDRVLNVNLKAPYFLAQLAARTIIEQIRAKTVERGYIVNISSISAYAASTNRGEYCIAKAGIAMATKLFAARLAEENIFVHEIRPGIIETDMTARVKEKYDKLIEDGLLPIHRWGKPEDVGRCVAAILRGDFPYSTGQVFNVDGGFHIERL